jgi:molybdopterin synthase catalytic subunit
MRRKGYDMTMTKVHVRYFAVVRERLGREEEVVELAPGVTVGAALDELARRHDAVRALRGVLRVAVNQEMCGADRVLSDGDELALIPPVAGGAGPSRHARVVAERAPSLDACIRAVSSAGMGGVVTFTGMVRDHSQGRSVVRLEYEAYPEMAEKVFDEICGEIERFFAGCRVALEHRTGNLVVGDVAVVIAVAAPHRQEAFRACHEVIDRLKARAPIWKKEIGPDGASWVGLGP